MYPRVKLIRWVPPPPPRKEKKEEKKERQEEKCVGGGGGGEERARTASNLLNDSLLSLVNWKCYMPYTTWRLAFLIMLHWTHCSEIKSVEIQQWNGPIREHSLQLTYSSSRLQQILTSHLSCEERCTHCTGKTGTIAKKIPLGKIQGI